MASYKTVTIRVAFGNALHFRADVLALKYAQLNHGVDAAAYEALASSGRTPSMPAVGSTTSCIGSPPLGSTRVLFVGVPPLRNFGYEEIRNFGRTVLETLARDDPNTEHVALTLHGPGYGLDETEAFSAELAGVIEAIEKGDFPDRLMTVTFVERDSKCASRLELVLKQLLPTGGIPLARDALRSLEAEAQTTLRSAGYASAEKPRVFVAMPFVPEMDDLFHYGIQGATNAAGLLCERADLSSFTGDVIEWVKGRISTAKLVVADLSTANPNVYLEVGYAWGKGVPTVLLAKDGNDLKFDVKTQRCLVYKSIKHLEDLLARELKELA